MGFGSFWTLGQGRGATAAGRGSTAERWEGFAARTLRDEGFVPRGFVYMGCLGLLVLGLAVGAYQPVSSRSSRPGQSVCVQAVEPTTPHSPSCCEEGSYALPPARDPSRRPRSGVLSTSASAAASSGGGGGSISAGGGDTLGKRLLKLIYPKRSALVVLRRWAEEGRTVQKYQLNRVVRELRKYRRFKHALEVLPARPCHCHRVTPGRPPPVCCIASRPDPVLHHAECRYASG